MMRYRRTRNKGPTALKRIDLELVQLGNEIANAERCTFTKATKLIAKRYKRGFILLK